MAIKSISDPQHVMHSERAKRYWSPEEDDRIIPTPLSKWRESGKTSASTSLVAVPQATDCNTKITLKKKSSGSKTAR
jgi:hypothetical protein